MAHKHSKQILYIENKQHTFQRKSSVHCRFCESENNSHKQIVQLLGQSWSDDLISRSLGTDIALEQPKYLHSPERVLTDSHKQTFPIRTVWKVAERVRWQRDTKRCEDIQAEDAVRSKGGQTRPRSPGKNKSPLVQQLVPSCPLNIQDIYSNVLK